MKIEINLAEPKFGQHMVYFKYTYSDREQFLFEKKHWRMAYGDMKMN